MISLPKKRSPIMLVEFHDPHKIVLSKVEIQMHERLKRLQEENDKLVEGVILS